MNEHTIALMRDRIRRTRKIIPMAHHPRMIRMLEETVPGAEAEVARLESEGGGEIIRIEVKDGPPRA